MVHFQWYFSYLKDMNWFWLKIQTKHNCYLILIIESEKTEKKIIDQDFSALIFSTAIAVNRCSQLYGHEKITEND